MTRTLSARTNVNRSAWRSWIWLWLILAGTLTGCMRDVPLTHRKQFLLVPESQELSLGATAYQDTLKKEPLSQNKHYVEIVNRVGRRLADATGEKYEWEFNVVASPVQNAFCLPGGKVVIYEGIMPICQSEAGLAVVMSHEIAHAVARHGGERMTHSIAVDTAKQCVSWFTRDVEETNRQRIMGAYGVAANVGFVLPYSRAHESEADEMGLLYMAKAGYDPSEAPRFWERFATMTAGEKPPEFLSTHPSDDRRAKDLQAKMPDAMGLYVAATMRYGLGEPIMAPPGASQQMIAGQNAVPTGVQPAGFQSGMPPTGVGQQIQTNE